MVSKSLVAEAVLQALRDANCQAIDIEAAFFSNTTQSIIEGQHLIRGQIDLDVIIAGLGVRYERDCCKRDDRPFAAILKPTRTAEWIVYAKTTFAGPEQLLAYLARYTHRVAISNDRLLDFNETRVSFFSMLARVLRSRPSAHKSMARRFAWSECNADNWGNGSSSDANDYLRANNLSKKRILVDPRRGML